MCCFSRHVEAVWNTRIFARRVAPDRQALAYALGARLPEDLAMVLPLPVPPQSPDDAVRFVDLHGNGKDSFFTYLDACFPRRQFADLMAQPTRSMGASPTLEVHQVGNFVASFVPSRADFARLDARFRMPESFWSGCPTYADWGFAVFQLAGGKSSGWSFFRKVRSPKVDFHPMAFLFPTREKERLFFPTLHVHDGRVHERAPFDHTLYAQAEAAPGWDRSERAPHPNHVDLLSPLLVDQQLLARRHLVGELPNQDQYLPG
jgi:hypothetical protein